MPWVFKEAEPWCCRIQQLPWQLTSLSSTLRIGEDVALSRRVAAAFLLMTIAYFSDKLLFLHAERGLSPMPHSLPFVRPPASCVQCVRQHRHLQPWHRVHRSSPCRCGRAQCPAACPPLLRC